MNDEIMERELENQIPDFKDELETAAPEVDTNEAVEEPVKPAEPEKPVSRIGQKLPMFQERENYKTESHVGENVFKNVEVMDGWMDVDKELLGERAYYYPEDWQFKIRPATVEAIRNWSTLDDENANSIDDVFNEILKSCLSISTPMGKLPWGNINSWDRFFFILLIREYTFINGDAKLEYSEDCVECGNPVTFKLGSLSLTYDMPDADVLKYYSRDDRSWLINPAEFGISGEEPIALYLPTLEKEANIKSWLIQKLQANKNAKVDQTFLKFLVWMTPKIAKDNTMANRQIKDMEIKFNSWGMEMFSFMDSILRNIIVTPVNKLVAQCPVCGEEVTSEIRFQNGIRSIFAMENRFKKFGTK